METPATGPHSFDPDPNLKVWLNGDLISAADAKLSIFEHGLLYGDGIFEGLRSYNGRVFDAPTHLRRFFDSAKAIMLDLPYQPEAIAEAFVTALEA